MIWIKKSATKWGRSPSLVITQAIHGPNSWLLRHPRCDCPEPATIFWCRVRPHDAADVPVAVEHVIIVIRPLAARARFGGAFEGQHFANAGCNRPNPRPVLRRLAQITERIRPTSVAAIAQPAPVKKPTQNQTRISWRLMVDGMVDSPGMI